MNLEKIAKILMMLGLAGDAWSPLGRRVDKESEIVPDDCFGAEDILEEKTKFNDSGGHAHGGSGNDGKAIANIINAVEAANGFSAASTASASYVDTSLTDNITIGVTSTIICIAAFEGRQSNSTAGREMYSQLLIDGTASGETNWKNNASASSTGVAHVGIKTGVAPATITCKVQYKVNGATYHQEVGGSMLIIALTE